MIDIREQWPEVIRRMRGARALGVLLSLDDLSDGPDVGGSARTLSTDARESLASLAALDRAAVAVYSGERLSDLVQDVRVPGIWYVANRGFELRDPHGQDTRFFGPEDVRLLDKVEDELRLQTAHLVGSRFRHRGPCLALDYSETDPARVPILLDIVRTAIGPYLPQVMAAYGRGTIEIRIRSPFDEKAAIRYVHRRLIPGTLLFHFGSDSTLLTMLGDFRGFDIRLGGEHGEKSNPGYALASPTEAVDLLQRISSQWRIVKTS